MAENATHDLFCHTINSLKDFSVLRKYTVKIVDGSSALLMFQMTIISLASSLLENFLRPLGQPTCVSQILAGMIFGPTFLGQNKKLLDSMFPIRSLATLWTVASFGNLFYIFLIAVKADPAMMLKPGRAAMYIGSSMFSIALVLSVALSFLLKSVVTMEASLNKSIVFIAASQSFTGFPVVAAFLNELKIQNTEVGRLALTTAVFADLIDIIVAAISLTLGDVVSHPLVPVRAVLSNIVLG